MKERKQSVKDWDKPLSILRVVLSIGETNAAYNQFSLPLIGRYDITICTYFRSNITPPEEITLLEGNDSLMGFLCALKAALTQRDYDVVHVHTPHVAFLFLIATIFRIGRPMPATVYTVHSSFPNYKRLKIKLLLIPAFTFFQKVVCCSRASFGSVPTFYRRLAGERLCAIPNGVDINRVDCIVGEKRRYLCDDQFTVATVGRLIEIKNPCTVLEAFLQSADEASRLLVIGEGPLRDRLLRKGQALRVAKQVVMIGVIPRERVYESLTKTDLYISASRVEGLPVAVLEAMACRCPVLLSDIAAHREIADGADFIPLIGPDDMVGFAREIRRFRRMSASEKTAIGDKCRKLVENRYSLTSMHRAYDEIYTEVVDNKQRRRMLRSA